MFPVTWKALQCQSDHDKERNVLWCQKLRNLVPFFRSKCRIVNHITLQTAFGPIFYEQNFLILPTPHNPFNYSCKTIGASLLIIKLNS
jgi:hypothetical protein